MRTTVRLNERILSEAKRFASERGRTLTSLIEEGLRQVIHIKRNLNVRRKIKLVTFKGTGLQPAVDLDHTSALLDLMEESA